MILYIYGEKCVRNFVWSNSAIHFTNFQCLAKQFWLYSNIIALISCETHCYAGRPCCSYSDRFLFGWAAFRSINLLAPLFLSLFLSFSSSSNLAPSCWIHARIPDWCRSFVHGRILLHSWSGAMTWSYVPVQSYSCSLRVFYRTLVV